MRVRRRCRRGTGLALGRSWPVNDADVNLPPDRNRIALLCLLRRAQYRLYGSASCPTKYPVIGSSPTAERVISLPCMTTTSPNTIGSAIHSKPLGKVGIRRLQIGHDCTTDVQVTHDGQIATNARVAADACYGADDIRVAANRSVTRDLGRAAHPHVLVDAARARHGEIAGDVKIARRACAGGIGDPLAFGVRGWAELSEIFDVFPVSSSGSRVSLKSSSFFGLRTFLSSHIVEVERRGSGTCRRCTPHRR